MKALVKAHVYMIIIHQKIFHPIILLYYCCRLHVATKRFFVRKKLLVAARDQNLRWILIGPRIPVPWWPRQPQRHPRRLAVLKVIILVNVSQYFKRDGSKSRISLLGNSLIMSTTSSSSSSSSGERLSTVGTDGQYATLNSIL